jgi:stage V sporulation protein K
VSSPSAQSWKTPGLEPRDREILAQLAQGRIPPLLALERLGREGAPRRPPASMPSLPAPQVALAEVESLVGLAPVKRLLREVYAWEAVRRLRREMGLPAPAATLHMVFCGPPGTGKTTVARGLARALRALGVLEKGHLVEVERADLVGEYVGHTAQRTREAVASALGGVLFVDEAYALARGGEKDFGREAVDTMVRAMEEHRDRLVVVLAGYPQEMESLLRLNPGLASRIAIRVDFPPYTLAELCRIGEQMLGERGYVLSAAAQRSLASSLARYFLDTGTAQGDARAVRNFVEAALRRHALRVISRPKDAWDAHLLSTLEPEDFPVGRDGP